MSELTTEELSEIVEHFLITATEEELRALLDTDEMRALAKDKTPWLKWAAGYNQQQELSSHIPSGELGELLKEDFAETERQKLIADYEDSLSEKENCISLQDARIERLESQLSSLRDSCEAQRVEIEGLNARIHEYVGIVLKYREDMRLISDRMDSINP